jgi:hypothetical protein
MIQNLPRRHLDVAVSVEICFSSSAEAEATVKALIPDNVNFPKGLSMEMFSNNNNTLLIKFFCNIKIETLINTVDEVLNLISLAKKVITDA